jgi:DNA ligase-1
MIAFAELLERLVFSPSRLAKIAILHRYFATQPDPDRGLGLAAVSGELVFAVAKPGLIRDLAASRTDPELFAWSYDFVGDLAETVALIWPPATSKGTSPRLSQVVESLATTPKAELPQLVAGWLDASDASVRFALLKLITGGLRVGASARLAKLALAELAGGRIAADDIEEVWHALTPPYVSLFAWLEGRGPRPDPADAPVFRPPMLAHPLEPADRAILDAAAFRAEWKWDGIRVQLVATPGGRRLYSRGAEDISATFPEIIEAMDFEAVLDGELLVIRDGQVAPFADLQQRLNRRAPTAKMLASFPVGVRLYDMLFAGAEDVRTQTFDNRRARLEAFYAQYCPARMDLSELIPFESIEALSAIRDTARAAAIEGLMLKRADSLYVPGRPRGLWWKWKRDPLTIDAVLMYAQRGHGKRSSFYSDYTFGLWREDGELVPVGKAYFGFTDQELVFLDRWVRNHTVARYGPVREVARGMVLEIAFDAAQLSSRHKSGIALRFPRIARIRNDKPPAEADRLEALRAHIT